MDTTFCKSTKTIGRMEYLQEYGPSGRLVVDYDWAAGRPADIKFLVRPGTKFKDYTLMQIEGTQQSQGIFQGETPPSDEKMIVVAMALGLIWGGRNPSLLCTNGLEIEGSTTSFTTGKGTAVRTVSLDDVISHKRLEIVNG